MGDDDIVTIHMRILADVSGGVGRPSAPNLHGALPSRQSSRVRGRRRLGLHAVSPSASRV